MKFNLTRFINLVRRDFITYQKPISYGLIGMVGFFVIFWTFLNYGTNGNEVSDLEFWNNMYLIILLSGGLLLTSAIFWEFRTPAGRLQYLSLPASHFEKLLSRGLYTLVLFPAVLGLIIWIIAFLNVETNPAEQSQVREILGITFNIYVIAHSIMLMFAVMFNRFAAPKALLTLNVFSILFSLLLAGVFWVIFGEYFDNGNFSVGPTTDLHPSEGMQNFFEHKLFPFGEFAFWYLIAPFFWIVSYFKMTEKEA